MTSSNPSIGSVCSGLGVPPSYIGGVTGIVKAYSTRVGEGPFPTELFGDDAESLRELGHEYGTTTGRPRRCGWIDIPQIRFAATINGFTNINLTKVDVLSGYNRIKIGVAYRDPKTNDIIESAMPSSLKVCCLINYYVSHANNHHLTFVYRSIQLILSSTRRYRDGAKIFLMFESLKISLKIVNHLYCASNS